MQSSETKIPEFSRFETNINNFVQLPISVLKTPIDLGGGVVDVGVIICGDSVVDDLVKYIPDIKKRWFVISTTQSHIIPENTSPDLHLFSNYIGNEQYLKGPAKEIPFMNLGDGGHFVNPEIFYPDESVDKVIDAIYVSKWSETKRVELFVQAAELLPNLQFVLLANLVSSERKRAKSIEYRNSILKYIEDHHIHNIRIIESGDEVHTNPDGSLVPGKFTKEEMRLMFQSSRMTILTAYNMEGINRSTCEGLCCDIPAVVTRDIVGGTPSVINENTGLLADPNGKSIAEAIEKLLEKKGIKPRKTFLNQYGIEKTNSDLREKVEQLASEEGKTIEMSKMRDYGGDVWSNDFYLYVAPENVRQKFLDHQNLQKY